MKTLYIVRHSKAVKDSNSDLNRALSESGRVDAFQVSCRLKERGVSPSLLISSPAVRAMETAKIFSVQFKYPSKKIRVRKAFYDQNEILDYIKIIHEIDDTFNTAMIFGHNPSFSEFARLLAVDFEDELTTTGVLGIEFGVKSWKDIVKKSGKICLQDSPLNEEIPENPKEIIKDLGEKLAADILSYLKTIDSENINKKIENTITKSSLKIAKKFVRRYCKKPDK